MENLTYGVHEGKVMEYTQSDWNAINKEIQDTVQAKIDEYTNKGFEFGPALAILPNHKISKEYSLIDYVVSPKVVDEHFRLMMLKYGFEVPVDTIIRQYPMKLFRIKVRRIVRK